MEESDEFDMAEKRRRARFLAVFGTDAGQAVLADLGRHCGEGVCAFRGEALQTAFALGQQDVWLWVQKILKGKQENG